MPDSEIMKIRRHVLCSALQSSANEHDSAECARLSKEIILDVQHAIGVVFIKNGPSLKKDLN